MARAAVNEGLQSADLHEMAALGGSGSHASNELRDFRRLQQRKYGRGSCGVCFVI